VKLYRAKVPFIAHDIVDLLVREGDIEIQPDKRGEVEQDLVAIMEEFLRRDNDFRNLVRDDMSRRSIPYDQYGSIRKQLSEGSGHPIGDDVDRFLCRQFIENMLISKFVDEVFSDDKVMYRKVMGVLRSHDVDEREIREEAISKIKNVKEGTVDYEIALQNAMRDVKKRRGLLGPDTKEHNRG
jgi:hypothetical protein